MVLPNYKNGSIVNLMSSIEKGLGSKPMYDPLPKLDPKIIKKYKNIVLMIIDGLGYEYLMKYGKGSVFHQYLRGRMTSVFPATTASAITTFVTGLAPQQHTIIGWHMYLKELGLVATPLKFCVRAGRIPLKEKINSLDIYHQKAIFDRVKASSYLILPSNIVNSISTKVMFGKKIKRISYRTLKGYFNQTKRIINSNNRKKIFHVYWPDFDHLCHKYGVKSRQVKKHFKELNFGFEKFIKSIQGTNTLLIITADHGLIDSPAKNRINLNQHPKLKETLTLPLCGDKRAVHCFVHPTKAKQFKKYIQTRLKKAFSLHTKKELIKKGYFGLYKPNKKLFQRVGDFILIAKDDYIIQDFILGEERHFYKGNHGGTSKWEMFVPLILVDCREKSQ